MKRNQLVVIAAISTLMLAGCSSNSPSAPPASDSNSTGMTRYTIGFVPGITTDPFFVAMKVAAEKEAQLLNVDLKWQGSPSAYSAEAQRPFLDAMLAQNVDGLIVAPTDLDATQVSVDQAASQHIPVIAVDTTVKDGSSLVSYITGDNEAGGELAAKTLAEQINDSGEVFIMMGSPTDITNILRRDGFTKEMKNHPNIKIVGTEYANSQPAEATTAVNAALLKFPKLSGIFAVDGTSGEGTVAALRNSNAVGKVKLVGYDAYQTQVEDLKNGTYTALIAQQPGKEASMAIQYMVDFLNGKTSDINKAVILPNIALTKDNLAENTQYIYPNAG